MLFRRWFPVLLPVVLFGAYGTVAVVRQQRMETSGFDLGIFEQGVRGYAGLGAPVSALKGSGFNLLGDHFSPVLAVLAPLYRLFPDARTLLLAQAALFALSALPVARLAVDRLGPVRGAAVGCGYGLSWGLWTAVEFDFHEIAFAVPLAAFAVEALARGRWRAAVGWALPLLLVKEDQGLLVAAVGAYVFARGRRALGAAAVLAAVGVTVLAVFLVIPAHNPDGLYTYAASGSWRGGDPLARLLLPGGKWRTVLVLLLPTAFLALRSPLVLLAVPPLAARFWSVDPAYWDTRQHYNAVLMPILFLALTDGLDRVRRRARPWSGPVAALVPVLVPVLALLLFPPAPAGSAPPRPVDARAVLATVPDGARVAAANRLAPQLTGRCTVSLFPYLTRPGRDAPWGRPTAEWVAVLDRPGDFPLPEAEMLRARAELADQGYREVAAGGGVAVYRWSPD
ncbi:DUF2079 domain-containing protein [Kitasatospora sp. NA04385]|uniref:DUF2079 domain-containing protein n=1 Tax=Kitasatospora sp. NA04385 TaxID=2742135 RepID=UPI001592AB77|nr:DUF2079 domain-containing protein [Kitasatospora sp. NA04385]QKW20079.1 DUF2079 domain-containing protein [Kitasatospora sp. NA04385]